MIRIIGLLWLMLFAYPSVAKEFRVVGTPVCVTNDQSQRCGLQWENMSEPRRAYVIERFRPGGYLGNSVFGPVAAELDSVGETWTALTEPLKSLDSLAENTVDGGYLYRLLACHNYEKRERCVASRVHWVPLLFDSTDDIPSVVYDRSLEGYAVARDTPIWVQEIQYNVYLLIQTLDYAGGVSLPPMSRPLVGPESNDILDLTRSQLVHRAVFGVYEGKR
ncbi:MAG: hypothetical protein AAF438_07050 [Pseudomonadota bacterium]